MAAIEPIRVEGLRDLRKALKSLEDGSEKKLRITLNDVGQLVVDKTLPWIPRRTGKTKATLKMRSTQNQARVVGGGSKAPWYPWLDFGGAIGKHRSVKRKFIKQGRYAWRTVGKQHDAIVEKLDEALKELIHESGLEVQ